MHLGKEKKKQRPTITCVSQGGRVVWTGLTDITVTTITSQDAIEPPNYILYTLITFTLIP